MKRLIGNDKMNQMSNHDMMIHLIIIGMGIFVIALGINMITSLFMGAIAFITTGIILILVDSYIMITGNVI